MTAHTLTPAAFGSDNTSASQSISDHQPRMSQSGNSSNNGEQGLRNEGAESKNRMEELIRRRRGSLLNLNELQLEDIPNPQTNPSEFNAFLSLLVTSGKSLISTFPQWKKGSIHGSVQTMTLPDAVKKDLTSIVNPQEHWAARESVHSLSDLPRPPSSSAQQSDHSTTAPKSENIEGAERTIFNLFRNGLLRNHSENERKYIESCIESERLEVIQKGAVEVWRMTYATPFPTNPRTFVILLVTVALPYEGQSDIPSSTSSKEPTAVKPNRSFMVISVPFSHPSCPPRQGPESKRVRGRYCSVEVVRELPPSGHGHGHGDDDDEENRIQWRMATTSDAGGNIPQWMTNMSLPGKISEDVPSFLKWIGEQ